MEESVTIIRGNAAEWKIGEGSDGAGIRLPRLARYNLWSAPTLREGL